MAKEADNKKGNMPKMDQFRGGITVGMTKSGQEVFKAPVTGQHKPKSKDASNLKKNSY